MDHHRSGAGPPSEPEGDEGAGHPEPPKPEARSPHDPALSSTASLRGDVTSDFRTGNRGRDPIRPGELHPALRTLGGWIIGQALREAFKRLWELIIDGDGWDPFT